ncbi:hypothetical protein B1152_08385, partial [Enterococcus faecium]
RMTPSSFQTAHSTISSKRLPDRRSVAKFVQTNLTALANFGEGRCRDSHCSALFSRKHGNGGPRDQPRVCSNKAWTARGARKGEEGRGGQKKQGGDEKKLGG